MPKQKKSTFSLKRLFSILFGFQIVLIFILAILIILLYQNQKNLAHSRDVHFNSYVLADELRQSSDDLTRLARSYVATGNEEFEREYWAVLDIRNGKLPRPINYNHIYWDFVSATGQKPRPDGETISLHDLMVQEGFTDEEFALLSQAQKNSDALVKAETVAMNAMKGLYEDEHGNFTIHKAPDPSMANALMNNQTYYQTKAEIMKPIDDFYTMFEARTTGDIQKYLQRSNILIWTSMILSFFILSIFLYSFVIVRKQITQREQAEKEIVALNKNLEQRVAKRTKVLEQSETKLRETLEETERINQIMTGRELKMMELKKQITALQNQQKNKK